MTESGPRCEPRSCSTSRARAGCGLWPGPRAAIAMALIQVSAGIGFQWMVPIDLSAARDGFLAIQVKAARIHTSVELTPDSCGRAPRTLRHRRHRAYLPGGHRRGGAEMAVVAGTGRTHRRTARPHRHRPQAEQRPRCPGVGAQASAAAGGADPAGRGTHPAGIPRHEASRDHRTAGGRGRRDRLCAELAGGPIDVDVAPLLEGEPMTTSVAYSAPLVVLSLFLAAVAGALAVLAIARSRRG